LTKEQLAALAQSLKDNEAFQAVLDGQRSNALENLATMRRDDEQAFYASQAIVAVVDGIRTDLDAFVRAGAAKKKPGIA
jgi:hypothetical protein